MYQTLSNVPDVDTFILSHLNDMDLYNVCRADKYTLSLCFKDKEIKKRVERIRDIIVHPLEPTSMMTDVRGLNTLYDFGHIRLKNYNQVVYKSVNDFILEIYRGEDGIVYTSFVIPGPVILTDGMILREIRDSLIDDLDDTFGEHVIWDGIRKRKNGKYVLDLE